MVCSFRVYVDKFVKGVIENLSRSFNLGFGRGQTRLDFCYILGLGAFLVERLKLSIGVFAKSL